MSREVDREALLVGAGSRLFRWDFDHPDRQWFIAADCPDEPMTPPRFLVEPLPEDFRQKALEYGEAWGRDAFGDLAEAGVDFLEWRQPLRHIESEFLSEEVFGALADLLPGQVSSSLSMTFGFYPGERRRYHRPVFSPWPNPHPDPELDRSGHALVLADHCIPPIEGPIGLAVLKSAEPVELAFPSWLDRDDRLLRVRSPVLAEGLVRAWRATSISRFLREADWEFDIGFRETAGGYSSNHSTTTYRWGEAALPDWVEGL